MTNSVRKGTTWTRRVRERFEAAGWSVITRPWMDRGDDLVARREGITLSLECKDHRTLALAGWVDQAGRQASAGQIPVVIAHRLGKGSVDEAYAVLPVVVLLGLLDRLQPEPMMPEIRATLRTLIERMDG